MYLRSPIMSTTTCGEVSNERGGVLSKKYTYQSPFRYRDCLIPLFASRVGNLKNRVFERRSNH